MICSKCRKKSDSYIPITDNWSKDSGTITEDFHLCKNCFVKWDKIFSGLGRGVIFGHSKGSGLIIHNKFRKFLNDKEKVCFT